MKALEIVEESDPQGTVVGVIGAVDLPSGRSGPENNIFLVLWYASLAATMLILAFLCWHVTGA